MKDCNLPAPGPVRFAIEFRPGRGHFVVTSEGVVVYGPNRRDLVLNKCEALQSAHDNRHKIGPRACLCCGRQFQSAGIHNRMCVPCRGRGDALGDACSVGGGDGRRVKRAGQA
jgi:hypothetical protein